MRQFQAQNQHSDETQLVFVVVLGISVCVVVRLLMRTTASPEDQLKQVEAYASRVVFLGAASGSRGACLSLSILSLSLPKQIGILA